MNSGAADAPAAIISVPQPSSNVTSASADHQGQVAFLYASITDCQNINRAIDTKVTALSVGLALPLTKLTSIWNICREFLADSAQHGVPAPWAEGLVLAFVVSWLISALAAFKTLSRIQNPTSQITGNLPTGRFYSGDLFSITPGQAILNDPVVARPDFDFFFKSLPETSLELRRELAFELMKVVFIRSVKMARINIAYTSFACWTVIGGLIWILTLLAR